MALASTLLSAGVIAAGTFITGAGAYACWERFQASHWVAVDAVITSSAVAEWKSGRSGTSHMACIRYRYNYGGATHAASRVRFGPAAVDEQEARETVRRFTVGSRVAAYVDPKDPARSILDRDRVTGAVRWQVGSSLLLIGFGSGLLLKLRADSREGGGATPVPRMPGPARRHSGGRSCATAYDNA